MIISARIKKEIKEIRNKKRLEKRNKTKVGGRQDTGRVNKKKHVREENENLCKIEEKEKKGKTCTEMRNEEKRDSTMVSEERQKI